MPPPTSRMFRLLPGSAIWLCLSRMKLATALPKKGVKISLGVSQEVYMHEDYWSQGHVMQDPEGNATAQRAISTCGSPRFLVFSVLILRRAGRTCPSQTAHCRQMQPK